MNQEEIITYSQSVRKEAHRVIQDTDLIQILGKNGSVKIIGSFLLDTMIDRDLDIVVECQNPLEAAKVSLSAFMESKKMRKYTFGDFVNYPRKDRPPSYNLVFQYLYESTIWEIEVWFFQDINSYLHQSQQILSALSRESRIEILNRKLDRSVNLVSKHDLSSFKIYQEVLNIAL